MYPFLRVLGHMIRARGAAKIRAGDTVVTRTRCWPQDLDIQWELNNGRALTLMDSGRMTLLLRSGAFAAMRQAGAKVAVAGSAVMYRRRVRLFDRIEVHSTLRGMDDRFVYIEQLLHANGAPAHHCVFRMVFFDGSGLIPASRVLESLSDPGWRTPLPDWISAWSAAEIMRPWPPQPPKSLVD